MQQTSVLDIKGDPVNQYAIDDEGSLVTRAAESEASYNTIPKMEKAISQTKKQMEKAAKDLDFIQAALLRDQMFKMQKELEGMKA